MSGSPFLSCTRSLTTTIADSSSDHADTINSKRRSVMQRRERIDGRVEDRKEGGTTMEESARTSERSPGVKKGKLHLKQVDCLRRRYDALGYHFHRISKEAMALQDIRLTVGELNT